MCIFCKITQKEIPAEIVFENEDLLCIRDIKPAAPLHLLLIPKKHYADILDMAQAEDGAATASAVLTALPQIVRASGAEEGFRLINNCREYGGQTVMHVHFHLLGKTKLSERII